jgi:hypothetical protein
MPKSVYGADIDAKQRGDFGDRQKLIADCDHEQTPKQELNRQSVPNGCLCLTNELR